MREGLAGPLPTGLEIEKEGAGHVISLTLPIRTHNPLNGSHGHWAPQAERRAKERELAFVVVRVAKRGRNLYPPFLVRLTRFGRKLMDDEGSIASLKSVRDGIADALGVDDGDPRAIRFEYYQAKGDYAVKIEIASGVEGA